jgi:hypothetical protein
MRVTRYFFMGLLVSYIILCNIQEQAGKRREVYLPPALPSNIQKIITGYARQLAAEILFIRTSVFLGGVKPGTPEMSYVDPLAHNFKVLTELYPYFKDPYFFCQSFLPHISLDAAMATNNILETGISVYPQDQVLRLYYASNFFLFMDEPLKASAAFHDAAQIENATPIFAHLAAILAAQGGDITAGIYSLNALLANETNSSVRKRYKEELNIFNQASTVQRAVDNFIVQNGSAPETLDLLVPKFIDTIPTFNHSFILQYSAPRIHLKRPPR